MLPLSLSLALLSGLVLVPTPTHLSSVKEEGMSVRCLSYWKPICLLIRFRFLSPRFASFPHFSRAVAVDRPWLCRLLGARLWSARGCENLAGNLSRSGKQQHYQTSPNHVRTIKGRPVYHHMPRIDHEKHERTMVSLLKCRKLAT